MRFPPVLFALALACGSSSSKPTAPAEAPPPAQPAPPAPAAEPPPPPIPEAPPPAPPGAPRPHVARAIANLPADAQVLIGIDVPRVAATPLGDKLRAATLGAKLPPACEALSAAQLGNIVIGVGDGGKVVAVLEATLTERAAVRCAEAAMTAKGAKLESKTVGGRKVYHASGSSDDNGWVSWTKTGIILANSEAALTGALDAKTAKLGGDLAALAARADHGRMVWGVSIVPVSALAAIGVPPDTVTGSIAVRGGIDVAAETDIDVVLGLATPAAATAMADVVRTLVGPMRGQPSMAPLLAGLRLGVHGSDVHVTARLDADVTRKVIESMNVK